MVETRGQCYLELVFCSGGLYGGAEYGAALRELQGAEQHCLVSINGSAGSMIMS